MTTRHSVFKRTEIETPKTTVQCVQFVEGPPPQAPIDSHRNKVYRNRWIIIYRKKKAKKLKTKLMFAH